MTGCAGVGSTASSPSSASAIVVEAIVAARGRLRADRGPVEKARPLASMTTHGSLSLARSSVCSGVYKLAGECFSACAGERQDGDRPSSRRSRTGSLGAWSW